MKKIMLFIVLLVSAAIILSSCGIKPVGKADEFGEWQPDDKIMPPPEPIPACDWNLPDEQYCTCDPGNNERCGNVPDAGDIGNQGCASNCPGNCGDDGCGGSCGDCGVGGNCEAGWCVSIPQDPCATNPNDPECVGQQPAEPEPPTPPDPCEGVACSPCESCSAGACVSDCSQGDTCVDGVCTSPDLCKDVTCGPCQECQAGICELTCNTNNCETCQAGACKSSCSNGKICDNGQCKCPEGQVEVCSISPQGTVGGAFWSLRSVIGRAFSGLTGKANAAVSPPCKCEENRCAGKPPQNCQTCNPNTGLYVDNPKPPKPSDIVTTSQNGCKIKQRIKSDIICKENTWKIKKTIIIEQCSKTENSNPCKKCVMNNVNDESQDGLTLTVNICEEKSADNGGSCEPPKDGKCESGICGCPTEKPVSSGGLCCQTGETCCKGGANLIKICLKKCNFWFPRTC